METESSLTEVRNVQRRHWTSVADAWGKWFDWTEENFAPLTASLRDQTGWQPSTEAEVARWRVADAAVVLARLALDPPAHGKMRQGHQHEYQSGQRDG